MHIGTIKMIHLRPLQVASIGCPYKYLHMSRSCKFGLRIPDTGDRPYGTESQKGNFKGITSTMLPLCISGSSVPPPWGPTIVFPCLCICYQIVQCVQLVGCLPGGILKQLSNATWLPLLVVACLITREAGGGAQKKTSGKHQIHRYISNNL